MAKKVIENHKVVTDKDINAAEELIKQQNTIEDFVLGEEEQEQEQEQADQEEEPKKAEEPEEIQIPKPTEENKRQQEENDFSKVLILTKAATYFDRGIRFYKNNPITINNEKVYEQLLKTGLFVHL